MQQQQTPTQFTRQSEDNTLTREIRALQRVTELENSLCHLHQDGCERGCHQDREGIGEERADASSGDPGPPAAHCLERQPLPGSHHGTPRLEPRGSPFSSPAPTMDSSQSSVPSLNSVFTAPTHEMYSQPGLSFSSSPSSARSSGFSASSYPQQPQPQLPGLHFPEHSHP